MREINKVNLYCRREGVGTRTNMQCKEHQCETYSAFNESPCLVYYHCFFFGMIWLKKVGLLNRVTGTRSYHLKCGAGKS